MGAPDLLAGRNMHYWSELMWMAAYKSEKANDPKYDLIWAIIIELIKNGSIIP